MERKILHIDMDAFFAAVEQRDNPALRGQPVIVGGDPNARGVVSTCSYEARKFGVHSAMPLREAYRRCPKGIFLPVRGARYAQASRQIMTILSDFTPVIEPLSLDEAFLDLTGSERIFGPVEEIGRRIVARIGTEVGLPASVGIAPNKFLAKLASDLRKPQGFVVISAENLREILADLPVSKLWGVGPKTEEQLLAMGIRTIGALQRFDPLKLVERFGELGSHLYQLAHGHDERPVLTEEETKSVGHEVTFQNDTDDRGFLAGVLLWLSDQVARRLRRHGLKGRTITVKIRDLDFKTFSKRLTLPTATDFEETIYREGFKLAQQLNWGSRQVRLIGISVSGFNESGSRQLNLFETEEKQEAPAELDRLHQAIDSLRDRYGEAIVTKGTILQIQEKVRGRRDLDDHQ
ncbi:DNA polymerase-4 [Hydrogenispora ethanolica]|uniref:DNA polymerase IV n=1 Tax=Hydrogenispora ethanolica TaxID=1082276 RepID=A0A4R1R8A5_HYDET|nr:DNA polymerase IV [Hydrogenispora ethanolica]TCL61770.1 DNA polymerase-4 [Hydrogenispora ethanolica]